mgnify:CR=1 FL=1
MSSKKTLKFDFMVGGFFSGQDDVSYLDEENGYSIKEVLFTNK